MFPNSDIQLCTVHMLRNAKTHLSKEDASEFTKRFRSIKTAWSAEVAASQFEELCDRFEKSSPAFVKELRKKRPHYIAFVKYPDVVRVLCQRPTRRGHQQTTRFCRNSGGYFHSETVKLKLGIVVTVPQSGKWHASPLPQGRDRPAQRHV